MGILQDKIIRAAGEVHKILGPGLLENLYESALCHELGLLGLGWQRQVPVPVLYKGVQVRQPLFVDVVVENEVVIEVKALPLDNPYYQIQLFTHLKLLKLRSGLLINFGKECLQDGISHIMNDSDTKGVL